MGTSAERVRGTVVEWFTEDGWGRVRSPQLDGPVFVHFSQVTDRTGFRELRVGEAVTFTWDDLPQDGCRFRGFDVWSEDRTGLPPLDEVRAAHRAGRPLSDRERAPSSAYRSSLTLRFDDGTRIVRPGVPDGSGTQEAPEA